MKTGLVLLLFAVLLAVTSALVADKFQKRVITNLKKCTAKHGTNKTEILKLIADQKLPQTQPMKCTIDCYMREMGFLKNGTVDWEAIKSNNKDKYVGEPQTIEKANKMADICKKKVNLTGKKDCEIGVAVLACLYPEAAKLHVDPPTVKDEM